MLSTTARMVAALLFCGSAHAQTVHRCVVGGELQYQQMPCANTGPTVRESPVKKPEPATATAADQKRRDRILAAPASQLSPVELAERDLWRAEAATRDMDRRMRDGTFDREFKAGAGKFCGGRTYPQLQLGLTEAQVLNCTEYLSPETVNTTTTPGGSAKQYVFNRFGKREYLYFRNGILTSFQQ